MFNNKITNIAKIILNLKMKGILKTKGFQITSNTLKIKEVLMNFDIESEKTEFDLDCFKNFFEEKPVLKEQLKMFSQLIFASKGKFIISNFELNLREEVLMFEDMQYSTEGDDIKFNIDLDNPQWKEEDKKIENDLLKEETDDAIDPDELAKNPDLPDGSEYKDPDGGEANELDSIF